MSTPTRTLPPHITKNLRRYSPGRGDEFILVTSIRQHHADRLFEARFDDGTGVAGKLRDAELYMLQGVVMLRFAGEQLGIVCQPNDEILLLAEGTEIITEEEP